MILRTVGSLISRYWAVIPPVWIALLALLLTTAPSLQSVALDGEFSFLPPQSKTLVGERIFRDSFSKNFWGSSVVIVVRRNTSPAARLTTPNDVPDTQTSDREFVENVLYPRLQSLITENGWDAATPAVGHLPAQPPLVTKISTAGSDREIGALLDSQDQQATLVRISLASEYMELRNAPLIEAIENLIDPVRGELRAERLIPTGLDLYLSGPAVVGKDMRDAARESAKATEVATILLVVGLLLVIYRAPVLALIPLVTVFVGTKAAMSLLTLLAEMDIITLFSGIETYVTVVVYGAGVDYCMFLMARYKEELDGGATFGEAIAESLDKVGSAILSSAGTTIVGIGMMAFAEFGKFREAGVAMALSLCVVLVATLTLTPALLRLFGRWAFWPRVAQERMSHPVGWISPTNWTSRMLESQRWRQIWSHLADSITAAPGRWWLGTVLLMLPLAAIGGIFHDKLTYGLLEELPPVTLSVRGAVAVQDHYPAGETAPVTVFVRHPEPIFGGSPTERRQAAVMVRRLVDNLWERRQELGIADIRSLANAHGVVRDQDKSLLERGGMLLAGHPYYVSDQGDLAGRITRLDIVFHDDPFARNSLSLLERLEAESDSLLPPEMKATPEALRAAGMEGGQLYFIGPTASMRDLKDVTNRDQIRIDLMVLVGVFAVLILLLRQVMVAGYLIVSVFFSYLVTLGATIAFFWATSPGEFVGLDWKVPIFLFTILVAVGEDYNIYLVTRVEEEQRRRGPVAGVREGLARTGGIISSCGIIMAGTFSSLMFGSLTGMIQLGFALALGVILDTFVVRPILIPSYLVMLNSGRFGRWSRFLGAYSEPEDAKVPPVEPIDTPIHRPVTP